MGAAAGRFHAPIAVAVAACCGWRRRRDVVDRDRDRGHPRRRAPAHLPVERRSFHGLARRRGRTHATIRPRAAARRKRRGHSLPHRPAHARARAFGLRRRDLLFVRLRTRHRAALLAALARPRAATSQSTGMIRPLTTDEAPRVVDRGHLSDQGSPAGGHVVPSRSPAPLHTREILAVLPPSKHLRGIKGTRTDSRCTRGSPCSRLPDRAAPPRRAGPQCPGRGGSCRGRARRSRARRGDRGRARGPGPRG